VRFDEEAHLMIAPDERGAQTGEAAMLFGDFGLDALRGPRSELADPLRIDLADRPVRDPSSRQPLRQVADDDLAGRRRLLEPGPRVHSRAGDEELRCLSGAGHSLSCVHPDPDLEGGAVTRIGAGDPLP